MFYQIISTSFAVIIILSNIVSFKLVKVPYFSDFSIPAGLIFYPLSFILTDLITEIFGVKKAKQMVYTAFAMNILSFGIIEIVLVLPGPDESSALSQVLSSSNIRIFSSLIAYIVSQIVDINLFDFIKRRTKENHLWLRNNGSTCVSQIVDTFVIDILYLYWGLGMQFKAVFSIMLFSFAYKGIFSIISTPLFYFLTYVFKKRVYV